MRFALVMPARRDEETGRVPETQIPFGYENRRERRKGARHDGHRPKATCNTKAAAR